MEESGAKADSVSLKSGTGFCPGFSGSEVVVDSTLAIELSMGCCIVS